MNKMIRILYVEDDPDIRTMTAFSLEDEDCFELEICASGHEALAKAPDLESDLILLDVMMPEMDGPTTLQQLRQLPKMANTPAIFMTAKVQPPEVAYYKSLGAIGVIKKPFDPITLADDIHKLLSNSDD